MWHDDNDHSTEHGHHEQSIDANESIPYTQNDDWIVEQVGIGAEQHNSQQHRSKKFNDWSSSNKFSVIIHYNFNSHTII